MANILTATEGSNVLRCAVDDAEMLALLPLVDGYVKQATGRDWTVDSTIRPEAKAAARLLLVQWHEDPGGLTNTLGPGRQAALAQLEALALRYRRFEGVSSAGSIYLPGVHEGDDVSAVRGVQGATGDQSANFETVISTDDYIQQTSGSDLSSQWFEALIVPVEVL